MLKNKTFEVIRFEVMRNLKKPSFWISAILIPVVFIAYILIVGMTSYNAGESISNGSNTDEMTLGYYDGANYLQTDEVTNSKGEQQKLQKYDSAAAGIEAVKSGKIDVFYLLPENIGENQHAEVYAKPEHLSFTSDYSMPLQQLLKQSAMTKLSDLDLAVVTDTLEYRSVNYDENNNEVSKSDLVSKMVGPVVAFALFELINMVLSSRLANAMVEEKENRISELLLTSIKPIQLITGKIISLMIVGILQIAVLTLPMLILFFIAKERGVIPSDFAIVLDYGQIATYILLVVISYFLITSSYVLIGTISPTAKDSANYASIFIILSILPLLTINIFTTSEVGIVARIMTYFPYSSLLATAFRAIFGNLETWELFVGAASALITGLLVMRFATYLYCKNSIDLKLNFDFKKIFTETRKDWKKN